MMYAILSFLSHCFVIYLPIQVLTLTVTIGMYLYWRVWFFTTQLLYTITFESKNMIDQIDCEPGNCSWWDVPERAPFLLCLLVLLGLNLISVSRLVRVGYRLLFPAY